MDNPHLLVLNERRFHGVPPAPTDRKLAHASGDADALFEHKSAHVVAAELERISTVHDDRLTTAVTRKDIGEIVDRTTNLAVLARLLRHGLPEREREMAAARILETEGSVGTQLLTTALWNQPDLDLLLDRIDELDPEFAATGPPRNHAARIEDAWERGHRRADIETLLCTRSGAIVLDQMLHDGYRFADVLPVAAILADMAYSIRLTGPPVDLVDETVLVNQIDTAELPTEIAAPHDVAARDFVEAVSNKTLAALLTAIDEGRMKVNEPLYAALTHPNKISRYLTWRHDAPRKPVVHTPLMYKIRQTIRSMQMNREQLDAVSNLQFSEDAAEALVADAADSQPAAQADLMLLALARQTGDMAGFEVRIARCVRGSLPALAEELELTADHVCELLALGPEGSVGADQLAKLLAASLQRLPDDRGLLIRTAVRIIESRVFERSFRGALVNVVPLDMWTEAQINSAFSTLSRREILSMFGQQLVRAVFTSAAPDEVAQMLDTAYFNRNTEFDLLEQNVPRPGAPAWDRACLSRQVRGVLTRLVFATLGGAYDKMTPEEYGAYVTWVATQPAAGSMAERARVLVARLDQRAIEDEASLLICCDLLDSFEGSIDELIDTSLSLTATPAGVV